MFFPQKRGPSEINLKITFNPPSSVKNPESMNM